MVFILCSLNSDFTSSSTEIISFIPSLLPSHLMRRKPNWATLASLCPSFQKGPLRRTRREGVASRCASENQVSPTHSRACGIFIRSLDTWSFTWMQLGLLYFKEALQWKVCWPLLYINALTLWFHDSSGVCVFVCVYVCVCVCVCYVKWEVKVLFLCYKKWSGFQSMVSWVLMCWEFSRAACSVHIHLFYLCAHMSPKSPGWDTFPGSFQEPPLRNFDPQGITQSGWLYLAPFLLVTPLSPIIALKSSFRENPSRPVHGFPDSLCLNPNCRYTSDSYFHFFPKEIKYCFL